MGYSPQGSSVCGIFLGKNTGVGYRFLFWADFPNPGIEPGSPKLQADPLLTEPPEKSLKKPGFLLLKQWSMGQQGQHHLRTG